MKFVHVRSTAIFIALPLFANASAGRHCTCLFTDAIFKFYVSSPASNIEYCLRTKVDPSQYVVTSSLFLHECFGATAPLKIEEIEFNNSEDADTGRIFLSKIGTTNYYFGTGCQMQREKKTPPGEAKPKVTYEKAVCGIAGHVDIGSGPWKYTQDGNSDRSRLYFLSN